MPTPLDLFAPVSTIKGVGPKTAALLESVGLHTVGDLLYFLPRVYENYQTATAIRDLRPGKVMLRGKISDLKTSRTRRRNLTITEGVIRDHTGAIRTIWFNQPYRTRQFDERHEYFFTGTYELRNGRYALNSPSAVLASDIDQDNSNGFVPLYSARSSLKPATFRKIIQNLRSEFARIPDLLPFLPEAPSYVKPHARSEALYLSHFPTSDADTARGRTYLAYEELFEFILAAKLNKLDNAKLRATEIPFDANFIKAVVTSLPFTLTNAQRRATWEILQDLMKPTPMNRLLQGDVGSGKTVVAALASAEVCSHGSQTAILAPTAILATQHYESLTSLFANAKQSNPTLRLPRLALLTGATKSKPKLKAAIAAGEIDLIIGTHALLTDDTIFHHLDLCIIDEQHRFGVEQRQKLLLKSPDGLAPHLLSMTATPIPRSLQLTIFGDLDVSILGELPAGRQPITTKILPETSQKDQLFPSMSSLLSQGQQIYWICPLIDETAATIASKSSSTSSSRQTSPKSDADTVSRQAKKLATLFPKHHIGILHGKMKPAEKDAVMADFAAGKIDILVSTTVVEVGVNVPNANMIIISNAESFGLAQLHQLRGRVGRGNQPASCFLLTDAETKPSRRLREMEKSTDGFHLAEVDLKLRGPGEIYGSLQHGELNLRIANLDNTQAITAASRHAAAFAKHPEDMLKYKELSRRIQKYQQLTTLN